MNRNPYDGGKRVSAVLVCSALFLGFVSDVCGSTLIDDDNQGLQKKASWTIPTFAQVAEELNQIAMKDADQAKVDQVKAMWAGQIDTDQVSLLRRYVETVILIYPESRELCQRVLSEEISQTQLQAEFLSNENYPISIRDNLRLGFARTMVKNGLYDEAIVHLETIDVESVIDPASLLFFRAICYRNLLNKDKALKMTELLLENEHIPARYREIAQLISADIQPLKVDSLDEISRMMEDIHRRQKLQRSGTKVRKVEDDVIAKLDKMIDELEKQAQAQQQSAGSTGDAPTKPAEDSVDGGGKGAGNVDKKQQIDGGSWGDLPPKDREASMAELVKDLPPHYRQVIEAYFKKIAGDDPRK